MVKQLPTRHALAQEFAARLFVAIGPANFDEVVRRNKAHANDSACASHDFCDANMIMLDAVQALCPSAEVDDVLNDSTWTDLWNAAWDEAKASAFNDFATSTKV